MSALFVIVDVFCALETCGKEDFCFSPRKRESDYRSHVNHEVQTVFVTQPKYPPFPETGAAIPLSHCVSCGIADYRCYPPTSFPENGLSQSKTGLGGGVSQKKLAPEAYRAIAGIA